MKTLPSRLHPLPIPPPSSSRAPAPHCRHRHAIGRTFFLAAAVAVGCGSAAVGAASYNASASPPYSTLPSRQNHSRYTLKTTQQLLGVGEEPLYNDDDDFQADLRVSNTLKIMMKAREKKKGRDKGMEKEEEIE